jgi:glycosyltransferase involved in cell wall biosynthesis
VASKNIINAANSVGLPHKVISLENRFAVKKLATREKNGDVIDLPFGSIQDSQFSFFLSDLMGAPLTLVKSRVLDCDIIHILNLPKELYGSVLRFGKSPLVCHLYHSLVPSEYTGLYRVRKIAMQTRVFQKLFRGVICSNKVMTNQLSNLGYRNVFFVPFPVDTRRFNSDHEPPSLDDKYNKLRDAYVLAYVGRLDPSRGVFDLVRAFNIVLREVPNTYLLIAHPELEVERGLLSVLLELLRSLGIREKVIILGRIAEISTVYNAADLIVLPFRQAHFYTDPPLVVLEVMASGTPLLTTRLGAISEIVENEHNGVILEQCKVVSMAERIVESLRNPQKLKRMGENAREKMEKEFSFEVVGRRLREIYESVLNEKN